MKQLLIFFALLVLLLIGVVCFAYFKFPPKPYPYPYDSRKINIKVNQVEKDTKFLIIGDRLAEAYESYISDLSDQLSMGLSNLIYGQVISGNHDGLHRTLLKLKALDYLPPLVIYMGGTRELYEQNIALSAIESFQENYELYINPKIATLLWFVPQLGTLVYKAHKPFHLKQAPEINTKLNREDHLKKLQAASYLLFEIQLHDFMQTVLKKGSIPILVTAPLSYGLPPLRPCQTESSEDIEKLITTARELLESGEAKAAFQALEDGLARMGKASYPNNSNFHYLVGKIALAMKNPELARDHFSKAIIFDCSNKRGNDIYNKIIFKVAKFYDVEVVDFNALTSLHLGKDKQFIDEFMPAKFYFMQLTEILNMRLRKYLNLDL